MEVFANIFYNTQKKHFVSTLITAALRVPGFSIFPKFHAPVRGPHTHRRIRHQIIGLFYYLLARFFGHLIKNPKTDVNFFAHVSKKCSSIWRYKKIAMSKFFHTFLRFSSGNKILRNKRDTKIQKQKLIFRNLWKYLGAGFFSIFFRLFSIFWPRFQGSQVGSPPRGS